VGPVPRYPVIRWRAGARLFYIDVNGHSLALRAAAAAAAAERLI